MNNILKIFAILSLPLLLNACGGGGGGGGSAGGAASYTVPSCTAVKRAGSLTVVRRHLCFEQRGSINLAFCVKLSNPNLFLVGQPRRHGSSGNKKRRQMTKLQGTHYQARHDLVANAQHQHSVKHLMGQGDGCCLRDDVPTE